MNVQDALRRLNGYLQRRGTVDGSGGWTNQWILDILNDANLDVYHRIVNYGPEIFQTVTRWTYPANAESVDITDHLGTRPMAIWFAGHLVLDQDVGPNNMPIQIDMPRRTDLGDGISSTISGRTGLTGNPIPFDPSTGLGGGAAISLNPFGGAHSKGYLLGDRFLLRAIPRQDTFMHMRWTPIRLSTISDDGDELLGGQLEQFHPAVVLKAAISAKSSKGEDIGMLNALYNEIVGPHDSKLKMGCRQRQRQQPPQREPMRWEY